MASLRLHARAQVRRVGPTGTRPSRDTGDLRLSRAHAQVRAHEKQAGEVSGASAYCQKANDGQTARGLDRDAAQTSPAHRAAGTLARLRRTRSSRLLRGTDQRPRARSIQNQHRQKLVSLAPATQPAPATQLGTDGSNRKPLASSGSYHSSLASTAPDRQHPRQEPGAVVLHAGIRAGGGSSLHWPRAVPTATSRYTSGHKAPNTSIGAKRSFTSVSSPRSGPGPTLATPSAQARRASTIPG